MRGIILQIIPMVIADAGGDDFFTRGKMSVDSIVLFDLGRPVFGIDGRDGGRSGGLTICDDGGN